MWEYEKTSTQAQGEWGSLRGKCDVRSRQIFFQASILSLATQIASDLLEYIVSITKQCLETPDEEHGCSTHSFSASGTSSIASMLRVRVIQI